MAGETIGYISKKIESEKPLNVAIPYYYWAKNNSGSQVTKTLSPSFFTIMVFNLSAEPIRAIYEERDLTVDKILVLGPLKHSFKYTIPAEGEIFVVNFKEDSLYRFFKSAVINASQVSEADDLTGADCFSQLWSQLKTLDTPEEYTASVRDFSLGYLSDRDSIVEKLLGYRNHPAIDPIASTAIDASVSKRTVQNKHKEHFGYSAKELNRYERFSKTVSILNQKLKDNEEIDWIDMVTLGGYYDQSQLIHDFNHFIDCTPTEYVNLHENICIIENG